jgi:hypothetical protein
MRSIYAYDALLFIFAIDASLRWSISDDFFCGSKKKCLTIVIRFDRIRSNDGNKTGKENVMAKFKKHFETLEVIWFTGSVDNGFVVEAEEYTSNSADYYRSLDDFLAMCRECFGTKPTAEEIQRVLIPLEEWISEDPATRKPIADDLIRDGYL